MSDLDLLLLSTNVSDVEREKCYMMNIQYSMVTTLLLPTEIRDRSLHFSNPIYERAQKQRTVQGKVVCNIRRSGSFAS